MFLFYFHFIKITVDYIHKFRKERERDEISRGI